MYVVIKTEDGSLHEASSMYQSQYEGNAAFAMENVMSLLILPITGLL